ncbi:hypothetical protein HXX76_014363 [Chlamydomonas incerta]|uniref:cyclin-dependent kinase n=1 Tax=Chlamydomonas incerta TaxID=51695 RepID=A0A835SJK3_CHLIN|nr:hypothetical protein HXX76_014363 [Chlamydomonas incerta]|eukprot:KAG2424638.1 hypothetical protein HXX76_014363 [Chlamydomonas incerta]
MQNYDYIQTVGEGAYGEVWQCRDKTTGRIVAVKGFKAAHEDKDIMRLAVREAKMLEAVSHENLVRLITAFKSKSGRVYMVFDYAGNSVQSNIERAGGGLGSGACKLLSWQLLQALAYLHAKRVLHRDIKPANILVDSAGVAKLCDFGFARAVRCGPREAQRCTSYVVTRWYRAPEVLVSDEYGAASDIWSVGCTIAELALGRPLFPGSSTADQLWRIMRCFGPLPSRMVVRMAADPRLRSLCAPQPLSRNLRQRLPEVEPRLLELVAACLRLDPAQRPTAAELLQMPYFWDVPKLVAGSELAAALAAEKLEAARVMEARAAAKEAALAARSDVCGGGKDASAAGTGAATAAAAAFGAGCIPQQQQAAPPRRVASPYPAAKSEGDTEDASAMEVDKPPTPSTPPAADAAASAASAETAARKLNSNSSSSAAVGAAGPVLAHMPVATVEERSPSAADKAMMVAAAFNLALAPKQQMQPAEFAAMDAAVSAPGAPAAPPAGSSVQTVNVLEAYGAAAEPAAANAFTSAAAVAAAAAAAAPAPVVQPAEATRSRSNGRRPPTRSSTLTDLNSTALKSGGAAGDSATVEPAVVTREALTAAAHRRRSAQVSQAAYDIAGVAMGDGQGLAAADHTPVPGLLLLPGALISESGPSHGAGAAAAQQRYQRQQEQSAGLLSPTTAAAVELVGTAVADGSGRQPLATTSPHCGVEGTSMLFDCAGNGSWLTSTTFGMAADGRAGTGCAGAAGGGGANGAAAVTAAGARSPHGSFLGMHAASFSCLPKALPVGSTDSSAAVARGHNSGADSGRLLFAQQAGLSLQSALRAQPRRPSLRHMDSGLLGTTEVSWDEVGTPVGAPTLRADPGAVLPHVRPTHNAPYQLPPPGCQSTMNSTNGSFLLLSYNGELQADMEAAAAAGGGRLPSFTGMGPAGGSRRGSGRLTSAAVRRGLTTGGSGFLGDIVEASEPNEADGVGGGAVAAGHRDGSGSGADRRKKSLLALRIPEDHNGLAGQVGAGMGSGGAGGGSGRRSGLIASLIGMLGGGSAGAGGGSGGGAGSSAGELSSDMALVLPVGEEYGTPRSGGAGDTGPTSPDGGWQQQPRSRFNWRAGATTDAGVSSDPSTASGGQQQTPPQQQQSLTDSALSPTSPRGLQFKVAAANAAHAMQEQQAYALQQQQQQQHPQPPPIGRSFSSTLGPSSSRAMSRLGAAAATAGGGMAGLGSSSGHLVSSMPRTPPQPAAANSGDIPVQRTKSVQPQPLQAWSAKPAAAAADATATANTAGGGGSGRFTNSYAAASGRPGLRQDPSASMLQPVSVAAAADAGVRGSSSGSGSSIVPATATTTASTAEGLPRAMGSDGRPGCSLPAIVPAPAVSAAASAGSGTLPLSPGASGSVPSAAPLAAPLPQSGGVWRANNEEPSQKGLLPPARPTSAAAATATRVLPYSSSMGAAGMQQGHLYAQQQQAQPQQPGKPDKASSTGGGLSKIMRAFKSAVKGKK